MIHRASTSRKVRFKIYKLLKSYRDQGFRNKEIAQAMTKLQAEGHPHLVEYNAKR